MNGYQYFFGGDMTSVEFTLDVLCGTNGERLTIQIINKTHLQ